MTREQTIRALITQGGALQRTVFDLTRSLAQGRADADTEEARLTVMLLMDPESPVNGKNAELRKAQQSVWFAEAERADAWRMQRQAIDSTRELLDQRQADLWECERLVRLEMRLLEQETARLSDPFTWAVDATAQQTPASNGYDREAIAAIAAEADASGLPF